MPKLPKSIDSKSGYSPTVLVLVPSYNHARFLPRRIESILGQGYTNFKLLVIDDGSKDGTKDYLATINDPRATIRIRDKNSGSPFSAWRDALDEGEFDFIWIAESDDAAELDFLTRAVEALGKNEAAALYFCSSWVTNEDDELVGHTLAYLREQFPKQEWGRSFTLTGSEFNSSMQVFGNVVPNMSSMLMRMSAFRKAFDTDVARYRLAADWLFVGRLASQGDVIFDHREGNYFRRHDRTARAETHFERLCFEYFAAIKTVGALPGVSAENTLASLKRCTIMFIHERGSPFEFVRQAFKTDPKAAIEILGWIIARAISRPDLIARVLRQQS